MESVEHPIPTPPEHNLPFKSHFFKINYSNKMHYFDEGPSVHNEAVVCVHGNPTWSYFYRSVLEHFKSEMRVVAFDHLGMGLSSRPSDYSYCLKNHTANFEKLMNYLSIEKVHLIVHDWGGPIGLSYAVKNIEKIASVTILNTAGFYSTHIPKRILLCRIPFIGPFMIKHFNAFALSATYMAVDKPMTSEVQAAYLMPYKTAKSRMAVSKFVQDIPVTPTHPTRILLDELEQSLPTLNHIPKLIVWGGKDFCFDEYYYHKWKRIFPDAQSLYLKDASHYVLEDAPKEVNGALESFWHNLGILKK